MSEALETTGMAEWVRSYCVWVVSSGNPDRVERLTKAWELSGSELTDAEVRGLEKLGEFKQLREELLALDVLEAKATFQGRSSQMARDFFEMAEEAKKEKNYKEWIRYGGPFLNRVWAEKSQTQVNTQVNISLGSGFASKVGEGEFEVVVEEKV